MSPDEQETGVKDLNYNLISVIYHATKAVTAYETFIKDAQDEGDQNCAQFLTEAQASTKEIATKAQALLAGHLSK